MISRPLLASLATAICLLFGAAANNAIAQPGRQNPQSVPPRPVPSPRPVANPNPYGGYAQGGGNYSLLTLEERELLLQGEISGAQVVGGALLSGWLGFGIGHAVQGRYGDVGWKFTIGEAATIAGVFIGVSMLVEEDLENTGDQGGETVLVASIVGYGVLRIWEFIDVVAGPGEHNRKVRAARWKASGAPPPGYSFYVVPSKGGSGGVAGLSMRF